MKIFVYLGLLANVNTITTLLHKSVAKSRKIVERQRPLFDCNTSYAPNTTPDILVLPINVAVGYLATSN